MPSVEQMHKKGIDGAGSLAYSTNLSLHSLWTSRIRILGVEEVEAILSSFGMNQKSDLQQQMSASHGDDQSN